MKKSPVKVIIRMRPTSNFAYQNLNVDEETGYSAILTQKDKHPCGKAFGSRHRQPHPKPMGI